MGFAKNSEAGRVSASHLEDLHEVKLEAGDAPTTQQWEDTRAMNYRIVRKYDKWVLPLVWVLYITSYLDRGNIGNAKTAGAQEDLGLTTTQWSWVLLSFYITYTCMEWLVLCWKVFPAHIYVTVLCFLWGTVAMCSGLVHNLAGLISCRVALGFLEAGFGAGVPYYLSLCYRRRELGMRLSILLGSSPIANCISGALAYGITQIKSHVEPWRLIFLIEGAPAVIMAPIVWFTLMDTPSTAKFLNEEERTFAVERMETKDTTQKGSLSKTQVFAGLADYKNYCHAILHFCCNYSFAGLSNFLPMIVKSMGYSSVDAQGLTAPPYLGAFIASIIVAWLSDRFGNRGWLLAGSASISTIGYALLVTQHGTAVRYVAIWLTSCGIFPALAINMTWMLNNNAGDTKKGIGMSILAIIGQCSSFLASFMFPNSDEPFYVMGTAVGCGLSGLIVPVGLFMHFAYKAENRRKDRKFGTPGQREGPVDVSTVGDNHNNFRLLT